VDPTHERPCDAISRPVDCSVCHAEVVEQYKESTHGTLHARGDPDAPYCMDCHDEHDTQGKSFPASPTFARNVPELCARCHRAGEQAAVRIESEVADIFDSYVDSIHGKGLIQSGLVVTATCADCHTAHRELPPADERSSVHPRNIADTCGSCHHGIEETFNQSIHSRQVSDSDKKLPTCEDCHTSHSISRVDRAGFRLMMMEQCGQCHESEARTFFDTFHGKVSRLGSEGAAKCYDCHGTHNILPPTHPDSTLSRENVVETCAKCHTGAHRRFAGYLTHATHHDPEKYPFLWAAFWFMTALLVGTLTFALSHTLAWLLRLWLSRDQWRAHKAKVQAAPGEYLYRRFDRLQRSLHLSMLLSFFTLALTGMSLKFSYMGWAHLLSRLLGGFDTMGILHRIAAVALFAIFFVHLWDVWRRKQRNGKGWLKHIFGPDSIMFNLNDLKELVGSVKWFFGIGPRPSYGRFTYWEKFDYFAVFWGIGIIGFTGLVLWFPVVFTHLLPGWFLNVATIIHSDEALLAVAFIFTVHFFNTHFRPDKFPMDPVIFTGRVPVEELKQDKPREYWELEKKGELGQHLVKPFPKPAEKAFRIFGFVALGVGLSLIALIVYSMLFGYR
jgi:predicted CXXCH cytochrome family protein